MAGQLAEAARVAEDAIDVARLSRNDQSLSWALTVRAWVALQAGDIALSLRVGEEAVATGAGLSDHIYMVLARCNLAEAHLEDGDPERCTKETLAAAGGPELPETPRPYRPHVYEVLARAALLVEDVAAADGWARRAEFAVAGTRIEGTRLAESLRARATVELARDRADVAARLALESAQAAAAIGNRVDAARGRVLGAGALVRTGQRPQAITQLELAHAEFTACGAQRFADRAARDLRQLGRRVPRRGTRGTAATGITALSGREREIAELVATGRTNRQIAAELFLSEKTVEGHLARVFTKLGVAAWAAVAARISGETH